MLIPCSKKCVHQHDGCCVLDRASAASTENAEHCPYYRQPQDEILLPPHESFSPQEPQQLL